MLSPLTYYRTDIGEKIKYIYNYNMLRKHKILLIVYIREIILTESKTISPIDLKFGTGSS